MVKYRTAGEVHQGADFFERGRGVATSANVINAASTMARCAFSDVVRI